MSNASNAARCFSPLFIVERIASKSGVSPLLSGASIVAPFSMSKLMTLRKPAFAAQCNPVFPLIILNIRYRPRVLTVVGLPLDAPRCRRDRHKQAVATPCVLARLCP